MAAWQDLENEVNTWAAEGRTVTFWWRDDDAVDVTPKLEQLIALSDRFAVPLVVAVIPEGALPTLAECINRADKLSVVQHGYAHKNHAGADHKSSEYPGSRDLQDMIDEINGGWARLIGFKNKFKVFVPPWNRIGPRLVDCLRDNGYGAVSTFGPNTSNSALSINSHIDIIDWRGQRGFVGTDKVLEKVLDHLRGKRLGQYDVNEPTGLLTHHLDHDAGCWTFIETFLGWTRKQQTVEWLSGEQLFKQ